MVTDNSRDRFIPYLRRVASFLSNSMPGSSPGPRRDLPGATGWKNPIVVKAEQVK